MSQSAHLARLLAVAVGLTLAGCSVEARFLDESLFLCGAPSDCGDGWSCLRGQPYTPDFCAPACDAAQCDGVCTGGPDSACLRGCLIAPDGTPGVCPSPDYSCIRTSVDRDEGVCHPVRSCRTGADCGADEACLSELLAQASGDSGQSGLDNLYCVPLAAPSGGAEPRCPAGTVPQRVGPIGSQEICGHACEVNDTRCPPAFACLTQLSQLAPFFPEIDGPVCVLGGYGLSCQGDANCFVGGCHDTGTAQGNVCTVSCNEASRLVGGCEGLLDRGQSLAGLLYRMECDASAPSPDDSGLCVVRYNINYLGCTEDAGSAYECASDLSCVAVPTEMGEVSLCTKACSEDADCNRGLGPARNWLYACIDGGVCLLREA